MRTSILIILLSCIGALPANATLENLKRVPLSDQMDAKSFHQEYCGTPCIEAMFSMYFSVSDHMRCSMSVAHKQANLEIMKWLDTMGEWHLDTKETGYFWFFEGSSGFINWMTSKAIVLINTKKHLAPLSSELQMIALNSQVKARAECIAVGGSFTGFGRPHKIKVISK